MANAFQWGAPIADRVWLGPQASGRGSLVVRLDPDGSDGDATLENYVVTPHRATPARSTTGIGGAVISIHGQWRETFRNAVSALKWNGTHLKTQSLGLSATVPAHAVEREVYFNSQATNPTVFGSSVVRLRKGQAFAIWPANASTRRITVRT